jgi:hypothetical protein
VSICSTSWRQTDFPVRRSVSGPFISVHQVTIVKVESGHHNRIQTTSLARAPRLRSRHTPRV